MSLNFEFIMDSEASRFFPGINTAPYMGRVMQVYLPQGAHVGRMQVIWTYSGEGFPKLTDLSIQSNIARALYRNCHYAQQSVVVLKKAPDAIENYAQLSEKVAKLEKMVHALWYAPGNPGAIEAKEDFKSLLN